MTILHEEALRIAALGYPVFPCRPETKKPLNYNGVSGASCDAAQINEWWSKWPEASIGLACHKCLIIDVDIKPEDGKRGDLDMPMLVEALGKLPTTPMARSGGGGWHLFFQRPVEDIVGRKGVKWQGTPTGIDIQVGNQYVIAPPSIHESKRNYEWIRPLIPVGELPQVPQKWVDDFLPKRNDKKAATPMPVTFVTNDQIIDRCRKYVATIPSAIMGQNGSAPTLCAANAIFWGFGLSEEQGWPVLVEYSNRCEPPWSEKELRHKIADAINKPPDKPRGWLLESTREITTHPGVDLSGLINPQDDEEDNDDDSLPKVEPVPNEYFRVPGFVGEVMDFCMLSAPYPVMGTAFCGAMALQAFLCSRKVREPGDLRPNLYLLALAGASGGKDQPRKINTYIMETIGSLNALAEKLASGEGLLDTLFVQPTILCQTDEIDGMIRAFNKPNSTSETLFGTLLTLYSSSASSLPRRLKAGNTNSGVIVQPHFTLFGTATPQLYYKSLSEQLLTNGFFARTLILDVGKRPFGQDAIPLDQIPARVIETARWWQAFQPGEQRGNLAGFYPTPITVPMDDHATKAFRDFRYQADIEFSKAEDRNDEVAKTVWGRANENAKKLSLVYACSENHKDPKITLQGAKWAMRLCDHQVRRQLFLAQEFAAKNEFDALLKEAIRILRTWHSKHGSDALIPPWKFKDQLAIRPREYEEVISELQARRIAVFESIATGRRPKIGFRLLKSHQ